MANTAPMTQYQGEGKKTKKKKKKKGFKSYPKRYTSTLVSETI